MADESRVRPRRHRARLGIELRFYAARHTRALVSAVRPPSRRLLPLTRVPPSLAGGKGAGVRGELHAQSFLDSRSYGAVHRLRIARRVDQHAAGGVVGGDLAETLAQPFMEIAAEALEPVGCRSCGGAGETNFDRQIKDQRQIRCESTEGEVVQLRELRRTYP